MPPPARRMHADQVDTDASLVRRLLVGQFPKWADLPIEQVRSAGTDNALYRLGTDLVVRLPLTPSAVPKVGPEFRWLPVLGPQLPLQIPMPLAKGEPAEGYPWPWSVYRWLDGENATIDRIANLTDAAAELAQFIRTLEAIDATGGPPPGPENSERGEPLANRDDRVRGAIATLGDAIEGAVASAAWEQSLDAEAYDGAPVWLHGDLIPSNLLVVDDRLSAVIDWGCLSVGDAACDLQPAWSLFSGKSREAFRAAMAADDDAWLRGRGWSLSVALIALPYYRETNPVLAGIARDTINEVVADYRRRR